MSAREKNVAASYSCKVGLNRWPAVFLLSLLKTSISWSCDPSSLADGRALAFAPNKGNCLACHVIAGGVRMGNVGPKLSQLQRRFSTRQSLRKKIWDPGANNPDTLMPPYGRNEILTECEIDAVVTFIYQL